MKVLLITTGGTIGSAFDGAAIDVCTDGSCAVADRYASAHPDVQFEIISPLNILSEKLTADDCNTLARALYQTDFARCDGVIVTVGSDNLAYLASLIGLLCGDSPVPVAVVAADRVLSDPLSNGSANFACAVELIRQGRQGVWVPYRNSDGVLYVHSATDIRQADLSDDFYSFHGAYGVFSVGVLHEKRPCIRQMIPAVFDQAHLPRIGGDVLLIHPYPMQDYAALSAHGKKTVLHTLYHSGTLDTRARQLLDVLGEVPLYLASLRSDRKPYASVAAMIAAGAIPLYDISPECAYIKLLLACAQDVMSIREFMQISTQ